MHKSEARSSTHTAATLSLGQVLGEAMQEINNLEQKNSKMQDVLNDLQTGILNLNNSVSSIKLAEAENQNQKVKSNDIASLSDQLKEFKKTSSEITSKLHVMISGNAKDGLLKDAYQSGLNEVKKKLSSLLVVIQQLSYGGTGEGEATNVSSAPSFCLAADDNDTSACNLNSTSVLDSTVGNLQYQLKDALDKNIRWQNYNQEREQYVSLLLSKYNQNCNELKTVREKLAEITSQPDKLAAEQRRHFDKLLVGARQELEHQRSENLQAVTELNILKNKYKEETIQLQSNVERWRKQYEEQREALAALNANYENEKRRSNNSITESKEKQSQIQLLQKQVQLFGEDFRAERKEKEAALSEVDFLKLKVNQLQRETDKLKKPPISLKSSLTSDHIKLNYDYNSKNNRKPVKPLNNVTHAITSNPAANFAHLSNQSITSRRNSPTPKPRIRKPERKNKQSEMPFRPKNLLGKTDHVVISESSKRSSLNRLSDTDSILQCPNCDKQYSIDEHVLLLEHIDVCGD